MVPSEAWLLTASCSQRRSSLCWITRSVLPSIVMMREASPKR
jgi:hypothetical protein